MAKFVHTSDWHLGKPFASIEDADKRSRVREARLEALRSVAELVREEGAAFVLVAGDLFDSPSPSRDVVSAAMSAVGAMEVPVLAIPGNHDHAGPGSVWEQDFFERERRELAPNLRVLLEAAPAEVGDAVIHPAPLAHRQLAQDPTAWLRAPEVFEDAGGRVRIVLAHGSVQGFSSDVDEEGLPAAEPNRVELDRLPPGAIDYVALGDWHGTKRVSDAAWYSGTPEPDRFPKSEDHDQGHVLVVDAARAKDPSVRPAATGRLRWHVHEATLGGPSDVDHLREDVAARLGGRTRQDLLRLTLDGGLSLAARSDLDEVLESLGSRLLRLKLDDRVRLAPSREELEGLTERGADPLVAKVAARLAERIETGDERGPAAELALRDLYSLAGSELMRLRSLKVRNYRVHRDLEVRFDDRLNLVAGPNEVGKSTVAEALHRALFLRPNVSGAVRERLLTRPDGGHPEVEVVFAADGAEWTLHKRFSGGNGTVRLSRHGETTLSGDEAEARLAELLRGEDALGGRRAGQLDDKWAHLWVWQGASGGDPAGSLQAQADQLIQRLQSMGGLGLYVSQRDSEVAGRVRARYEEVFTKAGKPRAGSELHEREEAAAAAQARLEERAAAVRELEGAAERYRDAGARLEKAREALASLEEEEARVAERLREVERLRREQEERTRKLTETRERLERLREADREIAELVEAIAARREDVATQETAFEALEADHAERLEARARAERLREDAARAVREARVELERRRARLQHAERREQLAELESVRERVEALEEEIDEATRALSELPPLTDEVLEELAALDAERLRSEDRLSAVAAEIEVLEAGLPVRLADEPIEPETPRTVTRDTELRVGEETRIRIRPGGGETLEETRALAEERAATLAGRLEELGCASLAKARETSKERVKLESARDGARAKLEGLAGEDFDARLRRAQEQWQEAQGALARFGEELPGDEAESPAPETLAAGVEEAERVLAEREETERRLEEERSEKARAVEQASGTLEEKREALRSVKAEVDRKKSNLELLEERVGDAERRRQELEELAEREAREAEQLAETEAALAGLDPDQLEADRTRLVRALEQQRSERSEADRERAGARALLESGGTTDPYADLKAAHAALDRARERERSARLRADALALLHETFETEKGALTRSLVAPLEERVNGYLRTIFADGSEIALDLEGTSLATPSLRRGERFAFEELSGGAREQFAVAVRLAAAELLAEDHDGALPIVLDDAFAYSDPERVRGLMRALDRAAGRGLQVVLMTCTPEDYASLGAHSIHLTRAPAG